MTEPRNVPDDSAAHSDHPGPSSGAEAAASNGRKADRLGGLMSNLNPEKRFAGPLGRCMFIGFVTLLLLIPLWLVGELVGDRAYLHKEAANNIAGGWGRAQAINGPALIIPYQVWQDRKEQQLVAVTDQDGLELTEKRKQEQKKEWKEVVVREKVTRHKVILPSELSFDASLDTEIRYRGIYRQALYTAPMTISGGFVLPVEKDFPPNTERIFWESAWVCVGVSDLKTIAEALPLQWGGTPLAAYKPGTRAGRLLGAGFHTEVPLIEKDAGTKREFSLRLTIRGSEGIFFTPVGENTTIKIKSAWPAPSFQGNLLPVERTITDQGFAARWAISNLTRVYPQMGDLDGSEYAHKSNDSLITMFTAGVNLQEPVTLYRMVARSVNYGILFIAVTFTALFVFEMAGRRRLHMVQYGMVGLSMSLFYLVLLSLSEHIGFTPAFGAASAVTIAMNSAYMGAVMQSRAMGLLMGGLLVLLYAVLFSLLRMEDFALLMGTGLVLVMMGALMFVTRRLPQAEVPPAG